MCCDHVTINVIWFNIFGEFLVSIVLQIKQKKCTLKLLTEYVLLKKQSIFIWIDYNCSVIVQKSLLCIYFLNLFIFVLVWNASYSYIYHLFYFIQMTFLKGKYVLLICFCY